MDRPRFRVFIAISLADPARTAVVEYLEHLRATVTGVSWVRTENLHLTLKFLGEVAVARLPSLIERLRAIAAAERSFGLRVVGVGAFPNLARPQALWVGVTSGQLSVLAGAIEAACVAEGFEAERRVLHPHVTLGRIRESSRRTVRSRRDRESGGGRAEKVMPDLAVLASDGGLEFGAFRVASVVIFRSELRPDGARHSALATLPLASG